MNKIRKGDQVIVLTGRDKGKRGTVASRVDDERVVVEGINVVKKHVKPNPMKGTTGGVLDKTMSIHQSNVAIFNPVTGKADRVWVSRCWPIQPKFASSVRAATRSRSDHGPQQSTTWLISNLHVCRRSTVRRLCRV